MSGRPSPAYLATPCASGRLPALTVLGAIGFVVPGWAVAGNTAAVRFAGGPEPASPGLARHNPFGEIQRSAPRCNIPGPWPFSADLH
jgi:hypothetical protein